MVTRDILEAGEIEFKIALTMNSRPIYCPGKNLTKVNAIVLSLSLTFEFKYYTKKRIVSYAYFSGIMSQNQSNNTNSNVQIHKRINTVEAACYNRG
jgi:hypothetical protein